MFAYLPNHEQLGCMLQDSYELVHPVTRLENLLRYVMINNIYKHLNCATNTATVNATTRIVFRRSFRNSYYYYTILLIV